MIQPICPVCQLHHEERECPPRAQPLRQPLSVGAREYAARLSAAELGPWFETQGMTRLDQVADYILRLQRELTFSHRYAPTRAALDVLAALSVDLERMDEQSCLPDGDEIPVNVAMWAKEWVVRLQNTGFISASRRNQEPAHEL